VSQLHRYLAIAAALLATAGCAAAAQQQSLEEAGLLAPARLAALPAAVRAAWEAYLERSRVQREQDRAVLAAEVRAAGLEHPTPAPTHSGFFLDELGDSLTDSWLASEQAASLADAIVSFQTPAGGWSKRLSFERPRRPGESWASEGNQSWIGTFDNGGTTEQLRFLAHVAAQRNVPRWRASFIAGIEYVLAAQFPNGCFPQVYPLVGSYHDAVTFNDDAMVHVLAVLTQSARGEPPFVPAELRARAAAAAARGFECILGAQVVSGGRPVIWGQQHDPLTLAPVRARTYEHASLAPRESAQITSLLMELDSPTPGVRRAVEAAVAWFRAHALHGFEYQAKQGRITRPGAGPLWARFAELETNRPIFSNRDGIVRYDFDELDEERRTGYGWYTEEPARTLEQYRAWSARGGRSPADAGRDRLGSGT